MRVNRSEYDAHNALQPTAWRVIVRGKDSGIIETNWTYAQAYWAQRAVKLNARIILRPL